MSTEFEPAQPAAEHSAHRRRLPAGTKLLVAILLAIPMIALALVPTYSAETPVLWGFPFFYWYQMLWVPLSAVCTLVVYRKTRGDR
jgi:hypothetical protein